ncbi:MAG TPA: hypothetical protein DF383_11670 [Deltaproteobacteria bacterium]|nr:hypothetical protein [Deltaproteobacteria bacterium]
MERQKSLAWMLLCLMALSSVSLAAGPELKFNPEASAETSPQEDRYGDKPLLKFGNDRTYFKLGGYGSIRFSTDSAQDLNDTFTFRRFVLTTDAKIASRFRIYSEIEFERFRKIELERNVIVEDGGIEVSQAIEGTNQSELSVEQAWFELEFANYIRLRGGGVLVPIGRFNINHDDNAWNLPRRPLVDRGVPVLPTTSAWDELGFGLNGDIELGEKAKLGYQIYVVNGAVLDAELESVGKVSGEERGELELEGEFGISTGTFSNDIKNAKAVTGRIAFSPALGHEIGLSGYWGRYTPDYLVGKNLTIFGFDWLSTFGNFDIEAEYVLTHFGGIDEVLADFGRVAGNTFAEVGEGDSPDLESVVKMLPSGLVSTKQGYWVELRYHFRPQWLTKSWFGRHFSDPQLIPVVRWEQAFLHGLVTDFEAVNGVVTVLNKENRRVDRATVGLAFRLNPLAVFQTAYEFTQTNHGKPLADVTNYLPTPNDRNHSFMFGAAFGF